MPSNRIKQLRQIPLFAELERDDILALSKLVKQKQYPAGHVICRQGEPGQTAYIVESGELRILHVDPQGLEREVGRLGPGGFFGETSLLLGEPRDATVEVAQSTTLLHLDKDEFDALLDKRPDMLRDLQIRSDVEQKRRARLVHFKWLDSDETVVVVKHRHDVVLLRNLFVPCLAILVFLAGSVYWYGLSQTMLPLIAGGALCAVLLVFILYLVMDHRDERYVVTNKRVVRREHTPLGREARTDAPLHTIQNVQESQIGLLAQVSNFGDLIIETAGERGHVAFREIPDPEGIREIIFEQIHRLQAGAKVAERAAIRDDLRRYFNMEIGEEKAPAPPPPPDKRRFKPALSKWFLFPFRIFTYFLPSLRYEVGDTITWRKHWIALIKPIALPTLFMIGFTVGAIYLLFQGRFDWMPTLIGYGLALVILFPWWLWEFDDWQNDIYQVTSTRIIDVERLPFYLREDRREASLGVIQNVQFEVPGALAKLLNYGSVTIETAGIGAFTFDLVKNPSGVQAEIFRRMEAFRKRQEQMAAERHRSELLDWFAVYDQIRRSASPAVPPPSRQQEA